MTYEQEVIKKLKHGHDPKHTILEFLSALGFKELVSTIQEKGFIIEAKGNGSQPCSEGCSGGMAHICGQ